MAKLQDIKVVNLLLDLENPRLPEGAQNQPDTIDAILRAEGPKTLELAKSIAREGLSPIDVVLVMPSQDEPKRFVVLEGNRRVTALKMLVQPTLAENTFSSAQMKALRKLSMELSTRGAINTVSCAVFVTRDEANIWIERRHRGDLGGSGVVRWGATESARFEARKTGQRSPALQVLDFVSTHATLDVATREKLHDVPITNIQRLLSDKTVRSALGLSIDANGNVQTDFPTDETLKGLTRVIRDLASGKTPVSEIYNEKKRAAYIEKFKASERPSPSKQLPTSRPLTGDGVGNGTVDMGAGVGVAGLSTGGKSVTKTPVPRKVLIPASCVCDMRTVAKIQNIYGELRRLKLEDFQNAVSVLFRVFLELSIDEAIQKEQLMTEQQAANSKLYQKMHSVVNHLESQKILNKNQAAAARNVANSQQHATGSITTLNGYVHSPNFAAAPVDLRTAWDNLQPFFEAIWPRKS